MGRLSWAPEFFLLFLAWLALESPPLAGEPPKLEHRVVLIKASPGCVNREEFDRLVNIAQQHMTSHKCPVLELALPGAAQCASVPPVRPIACGFKRRGATGGTKASSRLHHHQRDPRQYSAKRH